MTAISSKKLADRFKKIKIAISEFMKDSSINLNVNKQEKQQKF